MTLCRVHGICRGCPPWPSQIMHPPSWHLISGPPVTVSHHPRHCRPCLCPDPHLLVLRASVASNSTYRVRVREGPLPYFFMPAVGQAEGSQHLRSVPGWLIMVCNRIDIVLCTQGQTRLWLGVVPRKKRQLVWCSSQSTANWQSIDMLIRWPLPRGNDKQDILVHRDWPTTTKSMDCEGPQALHNDLPVFLFLSHGWRWAHRKEHVSIARLVVPGPDVSPQVTHSQQSTLGNFDDGFVDVVVTRGACDADSLQREACWARGCKAAATLWSSTRDPIRGDVHGAPLGYGVRSMEYRYVPC